MELEVTRDVDAPPERLWTIVTDIEGSPEVLSGVRTVHRLDDHGDFRVGTRWRETREMFGREATEEMSVTSVVAGRSYTVTAGNGGTTYISRLFVEPLGARSSRLTMSFEATTSGRLGRLLAATLGRAFLGATRRALQRDVDDIAAHAEGTSTR